MAKASEMSWAGYEDVPKLCRVCGGKVTLSGQGGGGFRAHTECVYTPAHTKLPGRGVGSAAISERPGRSVAGERWVAHTECLR